MKAHVLISMANRRFNGSTEFFAYAEPNMAGFCTAVGHKKNGDKPIGYFVWEDTGSREDFFDGKVTLGIFALTRLLSSDQASSLPYPIVSGQAVLETRQMHHESLTRNNQVAVCLRLASKPSQELSGGHRD